MMMHAEYLEMAVTASDDRWPPAWGRPRAACSAPGGAAVIDFLRALHGSLDLCEVVQRFHHQGRRYLPHDGLRLGGLDSGIEVGERGEHRLDTVLAVPGESAVELTLFRRRPFESGSADVLPALVALLVHPVANALRYRRAVEMGRHDPLTGLPNRAALEEQLPAEIALARRQGVPLSLLVADVDRFKAVNDHHGHLAGDRLLVAVARRLKSAERSSDLVFRYAGDEFVVLLRHTGVDAAAAVAERLGRRVADTEVALDDGIRVRLSLTVGVAALGPEDEPSDLFRRADQAMLAVKRRR